MTHDYNSPEYYAQSFRDYYQRNPLLGIGHFVSNLRQSKGNISFDLQQSSCVLKFFLKSSVPYTSLEVCVDENWSEPVESRLKAIRSESGRVSPKTHIRLFEEFILPYFKKAHSSDDK